MSFMEILDFGPYGRRPLVRYAQDDMDVILHSRENEYGASSSVVPRERLGCAAICTSMRAPFVKVLWVM